MNKDIFPAADATLWVWLETFKNGIQQNGTAYGLSAAEVNLVTQLCNEYSGQIKVADEALSNAKSEVAKKKAMRKTHLGPLRKVIWKMKGSGTFSTSTAVGLGIKTHGFKPDAVEYEPDFKADSNSNMIRVRFVKRGIERLEFYGSCNGGTFTYLGTRARSPFWFKPEPLENNAPQRWEIKAIGIMKDERFGKWSQTKRVFYNTGI